MQLNWKNLKEVVGNLVTSNKLSQEEAQRLQSAVDADATATTEPPAPVAAAPTAPVTPAPVAAPAPPAPVAAVVPPVAPTAPAPVAAAPAPAAPTAAETSELERLRAENAALKASQNQTIAAAGVPAGDVTNGNATPKGEEVNPHFADLKRIKDKYGKFGLTAEIVLD